jgi:hypothetical protein
MDEAICEHCYVHDTVSARANDSQVLILLVLNTANTIFNFMYIYETLVSHFGRPFRLIPLQSVNPLFRRYALPQHNQLECVTMCFPHFPCSDWTDSMLVSSTDPIMVGLIGGLVQLFLGWRVQTLSKRWWIVCIIMILALANISAGMAAGIMTIVKPRPFDTLQDFKVCYDSH